MRKEFYDALLLSVVISSTDAAAVFALLGGREIRHRVASLLKIESTSNDPSAIIATLFVLQFVAGKEISLGFSLLMFLWQILGGVLIGIVFAKIAVRALQYLKEMDVGYFYIFLYIFLFGTIFTTYGLAGILSASGVLAVFFAGVVMGNAKLPYKTGIASFAYILSFVANVSLFILLGLLVFPRQFVLVWNEGFILFGVLTFLARPLAVLLCLLRSPFSWRERFLLVLWGCVLRYLSCLQSILSLQGLIQGTKSSPLSFLLSCVL